MIGAGRASWAWQKRKYYRLLRQTLRGSDFHAGSQLPGENRRHLFLNPHTGEPFTPNQFDHLFKRIVRAIEAEDTRFGHGRHSCIVRLYRAGCTDAEVTAITGHASPQTTKSKYWVADDLQAAAAKRRREQFEARK